MDATRAPDAEPTPSKTPTCEICEYLIEVGETKITTKSGATAHLECAHHLVGEAARQKGNGLKAKLARDRARKLGKTLEREMRRTALKARREKK